MEPLVSVVEQPTSGQLKTIGDGLAAFNDSDVGPADRRPIGVLVEVDGNLKGGISGYTAWGWLYVQWLWLDESLRGQGLAARMLQAAEEEGRRRGCHGSYIDTFSPIALKVYKRAGYIPFGALEDFPNGRTRTFLQKRL